MRTNVALLRCAPGYPQQALPPLGKVDGLSKPGEGQRCTEAVRPAPPAIPSPASAASTPSSAWLSQTNAPCTTHGHGTSRTSETCGTPGPINLGQCLGGSIVQHAIVSYCQVTYVHYYALTTGDEWTAPISSSPVILRRVGFQKTQAWDVLFRTQHGADPYVCFCSAVCGDGPPKIWSALRPDFPIVGRP